MLLGVFREVTHDTIRAEKRHSLLNQQVFLRSLEERRYQMRKEVSLLQIERPLPSWRGGRIASLRHIAARKFHRLSSFHRSAA